MARITLTTRVAALEEGQAQTIALLERLVAAKEAPAKPASKVVTRKAPKAGKSAKPQVRHLVKGNRKEFAQANAWSAGLSTLDIAIAVNMGYAVMPTGWAIGTGYADKARTATPAARKAVKAQVAANIA